MRTNNLIIDISRNEKDKTLKVIIKENKDTGKILLQTSIGLKKHGYAATNISGKKALVKTIENQNKLLIKCSAENKIDDVSIHVDKEGHVTLHQARTTGDLKINNTGDITVSHNNFRCGNLSLSANKIINHGILDIKETLTLHAKQETTNTPNGKIRVNKKIDNTGNLINQGLIYSENKLEIDMHGGNLLNVVQKDQSIIHQRVLGSIIAANGLSIVDAEKIDNQAHIKTLKTNSNLTLSAKQIENNHSIFSHGTTTLVADYFHNTSKAEKIFSRKKLNIKAKALINDKSILSGECQIEAEQVTNNNQIKFKEKAKFIVNRTLKNNGNIQQAKNKCSQIKLNVNTLINSEAGAIVADKINGEVAHLVNDSTIHSNNDMDLKVTFLENIKNITSSNTLKLKTTDKDSNNVGLIEARNNLNLEVETNFQNYDFIRSVKSDVTISSADGLQNYGKMHAANQCSVKTKRMLENKGFITAQRNCSVTSEGKIDNKKTITSRQKTTVEASILDNTGKILAKGVTDIENRQCNLEINILNELNNKEAGLIASKAKTKIDSKHIINQNRIEARDYLEIDAQLLENHRAVNCSGNARFDIDTLNNHQNADISINGECIATLNQANNFGNVESEKSIQFNVLGQFINRNAIKCKLFKSHGNTFVNEKSGHISAKHFLEVNHQTLNNDGAMNSEEDSEIQVNNAVNKGKISAHKQCNLHVEEKFIQEEGELSSENNLTIEGRGELVNNSQIYAKSTLNCLNETLTNNKTLLSRDVILTNTSTINHAEIFAENKLSINGSSLTNSNGAILHADQLFDVDVKREVVNDGKMSSNHTLKLRGHTLNQKGNLRANDDITIEMEADVNHRGKTQAYRNLTIKSTQGKLEHLSGTIAANDDIHIEANEQQISAEVESYKGQVLFSGLGNLTNDAKITGKKVKSNVKNIINNGTFSADEEVDLHAEENIRNNNSLTARNGKVSLKGELVYNQKNENLAQTISANIIDIEAKKIINDGRFEAQHAFLVNHCIDFHNNGFVGSRGTLDISVANQIYADKKCIFAAKDNMKLSADKLHNQSGRIYSQGDIILNVNDAVNTRWIGINRGVQISNIRMDQEIAKDQPAVIHAEKNLILNIGRSAFNYTSLIYAGQHIILQGSGNANVRNVSENLYRSILVHVATHRGGRKAKRCYRKGKKTFIYAWTTPQPYHAIPAAVCSKNVNFGSVSEFHNLGLVEGHQIVFTLSRFHNGRDDDLGSGYIQLPNQQIELLSYFQATTSANGLYQYQSLQNNPHYLMTNTFPLISTLPDLRHFLMQNNIKMMRALRRKRLLGDISYTANLMQLAAFDSTGRPYFERQMVDMLATGQAMHYLNNAIAFNHLHPTMQMGKPLSKTDIQNLTTPVLWPIKAWVENKEKIFSFNVYLPRSAQESLLLHDDGQMNANTAAITAQSEIKNTAYITITEELMVTCQNFINASRVIQEKSYVTKNRGFSHGKKVQEIYLAKTQAGACTRAGKLVVNATNDIINRGSLITRNDLVLMAGRNILNQPTLQQSVISYKVGKLGKLAGKKNWDIVTHFVPAKIGSESGKVTLIAGNEIHNIASLIEAQDDTLLEAQKLVKQDVASSIHRKKDSTTWHRFSIKKERQHDLVIQCASVCSTTGNVTFIAHQGNIDNRGSTIIAAMKIILNAKGGVVNIHPFVTQTDEILSKTGVRGLGWSCTKTNRDHTRAVPSMVIAHDIEVHADLDVNIKATLLHAMDTLIIDAGRDINISYESIQHYIKSKGFSATLNFFGASAINHMLAKDYEKAAKALLHEFPLLASYDNLLHSKDTADITGNSIHAIYQTYKHLKEMERTSKDLAGLLKVLNDQIKFDPEIRLGGQTSEKYWTEALLTWMSAQRILLTAGRDINLTAAKIEGNDLVAMAERDINVQSGQEENESNDKKMGVKFKIKDGPVGMDTHHATAESNTHVFVDLKLNHSAIFIGRTLNFKGVQLEAAMIYLDAENLNVETALDESHSQSEDIDVGATAAPYKHTQLKEKFAKKQTTLRALDEFVGHIRHTTNLKGAVIEAIRGILDTKYLKYENTKGHKTTKSLSFGLTDLGGFSHEQFFVSDTDFKKRSTHQHNLATVSSGIQIITESDVSHLNRDLARAQELKKKGIHVRVVLPVPKRLFQSSEEVKQENVPPRQSATQLFLNPNQEVSKTKSAAKPLPNNAAKKDNLPTSRKTLSSSTTPQKSNKSVQAKTFNRMQLPPRQSATQLFLKSYAKSDAHSSVLRTSSSPIIKGASKTNNESTKSKHEGCLAKTAKQIGLQTLVLGHELANDGEVLSNSLKKFEDAAKKIHLPSEYTSPRLFLTHTPEGQFIETWKPRLTARFDFLYNIYEDGIKSMHRDLSTIGKSVVGKPSFNLIKYPAVLDTAKALADGLLSEEAAMQELTKTFMQKTRLSARYITKLNTGGAALMLVSVPTILLQIGYSPEPVNESLRQGTILGGTYIGATMAGEAALVPCTAFGPYTPVCVAGAFLGGGILGAEFTDLLVSGAKNLGKALSETPFYVDVEKINFTPVSLMPKVINEQSLPKQLPPRQSAMHLFFESNPESHKHDTALLILGNYLADSVSINPFNQETNARDYKGEEDSSIIRAGFLLGKQPFSAAIEPLFRGDTRSFEQIFKTGFESRGTNMDLLKFALPGKYNNAPLMDSAHIATTTSKTIAARFPTINLSAYYWIYEVHSKRPTINVYETLKPQLSRADEYLSVENERAFQNKIFPSEIKGCWKAYDRMIIRNNMIPNPGYIAPTFPEVKFWNTAKLGGYGLTGLSLWIDLANLDREYQYSQQTGNYKNTYREAARITSAWPAALALARPSAQIAAVCCLPLSPIASGVCGLIGGLAGFTFGYYMGSRIGIEIYDLQCNKSDIPVFDEIEIDSINDEIISLNTENANNLPSTLLAINRELEPPLILVSKCKTGFFYHEEKSASNKNDDNFENCNNKKTSQGK